MTQEYIGKTCPFCQFPLKADSAAVKCPSCKVPHHRECWEQNGGCTTFGCRETTCRPVAGERETAPVRGGGNNKLLIAVLLTTLLGLFIVLFSYINLFSDSYAAVEDSAEKPEAIEAEEALLTLVSEGDVLDNDEENGDSKHTVSDQHIEDLAEEVKVETINYASGDKYVGEFRDDSRTGQGTYYVGGRLY